MSAIAARIAVSLGLQYWKEILAALILAIGVVFIFMFAAQPEQINPGGVMPGVDGKGGHADVPPIVRQYEPMIREIATKYGLQDYTEFFLAQVMQESGGTHLDIFQSSESAGLPPGTITDPVASTEQAMKYWSDILTKGNGMGINFWGIAQAYNFGPGYMNFLKDQNQVHSEETAKAFALSHATRSECGWRTPYCYGDYTYVNKILKYFQPAVGGAIGDELFQQVMGFALKYQGYPYQWGGIGDPSFDCSGLWMMAFRQVGINLPRTAQEQYDATQRIEQSDLQPGDFVFFHTTDYNFVTHVGLYVGNNRMYDSNNGGIGYSELNAYWTTKIVGYGRVKR